MRKRQSIFTSFARNFNHEGETLAEIAGNDVSSDTDTSIFLKLADKDAADMQVSPAVCVGARHAGISGSVCRRKTMSRHMPTPSMRVARV